MITVAKTSVPIVEVSGNDFVQGVTYVNLKTIISIYKTNFQWETYVISPFLALLLSAKAYAAANPPFPSLYFESTLAPAHNNQLGGRASSSFSTSREKKPRLDFAFS